MSYRSRLQLTRVAYCIVSYDAGYSSSFSHNQTISWDTCTKYVIKNGTVDLKYVNEVKHTVNQSYVDIIEQKHKGYLHILYRYTITALGSEASFADIEDSINKKSRVHLESRMSQPNPKTSK